MVHVEEGIEFNLLPAECLLAVLAAGNGWRSAELMLRTALQADAPVVRNLKTVLVDTLFPEGKACWVFAKLNL
jgi:hypothetical protein